MLNGFSTLNDRLNEKCKQRSSLTNLINFMETQKEADVKRVRSVVFKRSVELLLLSIEKKAEESSGNELAGKEEMSLNSRLNCKTNCDLKTFQLCSRIFWR